MYKTYIPTAARKTRLDTAIEYSQDVCCVAIIFMAGFLFYICLPDKAQHSYHVAHYEVAR